jgi:membrane protease YdiL (CAAX protease family)
MGFSRRNLGAGLRWGLGGGLVTSAIGVAVVSERVLPARLGLELAVGIPIWLLVASPFQELFFRGWLQTQWERGLGRGTGLVVTTLVFTLWHYCWALAGQTAVPLYTFQGVVATFASGLVYGYCFQRTESIVAPWLAHALTGVAFLRWCG